MARKGHIQYVVTDPDGGEHTRTSARTYTHAVLVHFLHVDNDADYIQASIDRLRPHWTAEEIGRLEQKRDAATGERTWAVFGWCGRPDLALKEAAKVTKHRQEGDRVEIIAVAVRP